MCLATAYKENISPENLCMENVLKIESKGGMVTLVDIFGRYLQIPGYVAMSNFDNGKTVIREVSAKV